MSRRPDGPSGPPSAGRRARRLSPDETRLWRHVTKDVRRPERRPEPPPEVSAETSEPVATSSRNTRKYRHIPQVPAAPAGPVAAPPLRHGVAPGLDRRTERRMKRGKIDIDDRLDLHGHTQTQAHRALLRFLEGAHRSGLRTVLVITGKGNRAEGGGILQDAVPRWLNENPARQWVTAFSYANIRDGGTGALYVRVKRPKTPQINCP